MNLNDPPAASPARLDIVYGKKPWHGVAGFFGGAALVALAVWRAITPGFIEHGARDFVYMGTAGVCVLIGSFRIYGMQLTAEGLLIWKYLFWVLGQKRLVAREEIESVVLGNEKGALTVCVRLRDGKVYPIPRKWATLKHAQAIIDLCTTCWRLRRPGDNRWESA